MSTIPTPPNGMVSNTELILRKILGEDVTPLPPNSRVEFYLTQVEEYIERLATGATRPIGETTTPLTDGTTTNPIVIDGESYTAQINDLVFYQNKEFLLTVNGWREVGDLTNITASVVGMGSWTPGSATTHSTPAGTDSVLEALQKIDNNQRNDEANISSIAERTGTKNYFNYYNATVVQYPTTVTNNGDGSFTYQYNGTISSTATPYILLDLPAGTYIMSGCPSGGSDSGYRMDLRTTSGGIVTDAVDFGEGSTSFTVTSGQYRLTMRFANGYTFPVGGITAKPMICTPEQWAITHDYQPYAMTNAELTEAEKQNEADISLEQAKTTGMTEGGSDYITVGGIRVYVSATAPTGARTGDLWIGG